MGWSLAQQRRLEQERTILARYFPMLQWYNPTRPGATYLDGAFTTNSGRAYSLRIFVPESFPATGPDMIVSSPRPLRDAAGSPMVNTSASLHVLGERDGGTKICHFQQSRWVPQNTLYLVALKGRIWLEAYEAHLRTRKPLDSFLRHMSDDPRVPSRGHGEVTEEEGVFLRLLRRLLD